jgi:hypothetical protein
MGSWPAFAIQIGRIAPLQNERLLFHFPKIWFETSDFSRKRSHCAPQAL